MTRDLHALSLPELILLLFWIKVARRLLWMAREADGASGGRLRLEDRFATVVERVLRDGQ